jgi:voltage-gated sodium channel
MAATLREKVGAWVDAPRQQRFIIALIIFNAITLGLETSDWVMAHYGHAMHLIDQTVLAIFTIEVTLQLFARGRSFFKSGWSIFDLFIVVTSLMPAAGPFSILRMLRILRLLRLAHKIPQLRRIIESVLSAIPSLSWVIAMLSLIFYIFAVLGTRLYGEAFPEYFGGLGGTFYTLFQIMTLEGWSNDIARPIMAKFPGAVVFFISFILISTFTMLNLFIAIIVDAMSSLAETQRADEIAATGHPETTLFPIHIRKEMVDNDEIFAQQKEILAQLAEIRRSLQPAMADGPQPPASVQPASAPFVETE